MTRTRKSAKAAGTRFERQIADALADHLNDDRVDRRVKTGSKDRGDIAGVRLHGQRVVIECKNTTRTDLAGWMTEAEDERGNDDALVGLVISKRHGKGDPLDQWVHMTVRELVAILTGQRIDENPYCLICEQHLDAATAAHRDRHGCGRECLPANETRGNQ